MVIAMCASADHWDRVYQGGDTERSWYQPQAQVSLELIQASVPDRSAAVLDVGGGAATLVDDLVQVGYRDLTILDISTEGLEIARQRLGADSQSIAWVVADLTSWEPRRSYSLWHDRAVLHFMTTDDALQAYRQTLLTATTSGATVVVGVFGPEGPTTCSGLAVRRWSPEDMAQFLGSDFEVHHSRTHTHVAPSSARQQFLWTVAGRN
jgi:SAM-dependent methyltransferase